MTIQQACSALWAAYVAQQNQHLVPVAGVQVGTAPTSGDPCLNIFVSRIRKDFVPPESKPGVGYQGFQCVAYVSTVNPANLISDSGPIAP